MLDQFPGRFLEEIDQMDWPRYLRAVEAKAVEAVEDQRADHMAGKTKELDADTWKRIQEHDDIMANLAADS